MIVRRRLLISLAIGSLVAATAVASAFGGRTTARAQAAKPSLKTMCSTIRGQYPHLPKQLTVAVSPFNANLETVDPANPDKVIGLEPDLISNLTSCLGIKFDYTRQPFAGVITSLTSGRALLGITGLFITDAREHVIDQLSHMFSQDVVYTSPSLASQLHTLLDLCGRKLATVVGTAESDYMSKLSTQCTVAGKPAPQVSSYQDIATTFVNISNGNNDASVDSDVLKAKVLSDYPGKIVASIPVPALRYAIGIGIAKSARDSGLPKALLAALKAVQRSNVDVQLLKKWGYAAKAQAPARLYGGKYA